MAIYISPKQLAIIGLLLSLSHAVMSGEGNFYTKCIISVSDIAKVDQVIVRKEQRMIAQYFCGNDNCTSDPKCEGRLEIQSGCLVLLMSSISSLDRFTAEKNREIIPGLQNFTLDDFQTSAAPDLTDETHTPGITPTESSHSPSDSGSSVAVAVAVGVVAVAVAVNIIRRLRRRPEPNRQMEIQNFLPV